MADYPSWPRWAVAASSLFCIGFGIFLGGLIGGILIGLGASGLMTVLAPAVYAAARTHP